MSLGLEATGQIERLDINGLKKLVKSIAEHTELPFTTTFSDGHISVSLTDNGVISIDCLQNDDKLTIKIDAQTSIMGPGFHKIAVEFIDAISDLAEADFNVDDETEYYDLRDFERLKKEHFEPWLKTIVDLLSEKDGTATNFMVNWDISWPRPEDIPSTIVTPFGRFSLSLLINSIENEGISNLAHTFFPCPDEVVDPIRILWFNALYMLWTKCYFMPSGRSEEDSRINNEIIILLEHVINSGKGLAIPQKEYIELCRLSDHTPMPLSGVPDHISNYQIGFRKGTVTYNIGNVSFKIPGQMLRFEEESGFGFWNGAENDNIIRITAFNTADSNQNFIIKEDDAIISQGEIKNGRYTLTDLGNEENSHITQIQLITQEQFTLFTLVSPEGADREFSINSAKSFISNLSSTKTDIIEKIQKLTEADRDEDVVNLILTLPVEEQTDEIKGLLARAYNNLEQYEKALQLLFETKDTQEDTANWNFRIGYSYYYLGNYDKSLQYFSRALEITPDDEDTKWFVDKCQLNNPFADRVNKFWQWFDANSNKLERLLHQKDKGLYKMNDLMDEGLSIIGKDVYYNIGGNNELTFCVESHTECHYLYPYLVDSMPESLREKWIISPCKQPADTTGSIFRMYDRDINISEIMVSVNYNKEANCFDLEYYHPVLAELDENKSINAFYIILELTIGEGAVYNYIDRVQATDNDKKMIPVVELPTAMKFMVEENNKDYSTTPELPFYSYKFEPKEGEDRVRFDIICGTSQYMALNNEYLDNKRDIYDRLVSKGVEPLMLIMTQPEDMTGNEFLDFRYKVEDRLQELFDKAIVKGRLLGGAYGTLGVAYIDLLLYDGKQFLEYIRQNDVHDKLLALDNGTICQTQLLFKNFTQDSPMCRIK